MIDAIVFMGIQGSGKGTQAKLLAEHTGYQHINIGDLLREQVSLETEIGLEVQAVISRGELVSDDLVFKLVEVSLSKGCSGIVFDGFPRTLAQAEYLGKHYYLIRVYYLDLPESEAMARMQGRRVCSGCGQNYHLQKQPPRIAGQCDGCGGSLIVREDDAEAAIARRIKAFYAETYGLKNYFERLGLLRSIPADLAIDKLEQIIRADITPDL